MHQRSLRKSAAHPQFFRDRNSESAGEPGIRRACVVICLLFLELVRTIALYRQFPAKRVEAPAQQEETI